MGLVLTMSAVQCVREQVETSTNIADIALAHPGFTWDSVGGAGFRMYTIRGSYGGARAALYRDEVAAAIPHALTLLGERHFPGHLRVFVLSSRQDVEAVTGSPVNGWGDAAGGNAGVVARAECRPLFRHEVMHAVSMSVWGNPLGHRDDLRLPEDRDRFNRGAWLREGLAAAAENLYLTYSYRGMAAQWQTEGALLPIDSLEHAFYRHDDLMVYLQSGSLVSYLLAQYGPARFRQLWREGTGVFDRVYGRSQEQIESEWQAWLRATPASERPASIAAARAEDICPKRPK